MLQLFLFLWATLDRSWVSLRHLIRFNLILSLFVGGGSPEPIPVSFAVFNSLDFVCCPTRHSLLLSVCLLPGETGWGARLMEERLFQTKLSIDGNPSYFYLIHHLHLCVKIKS